MSVFQVIQFTVFSWWDCRKSDAVTDLSKILDKYEYEDSCIYGHAPGAPLWTPAFPKAYNASRNIRTNGAEKELKVVYFPSCLNQAMGIDKSSKGLKPLYFRKVDV